MNEAGFEQTQKLLNGASTGDQDALHQLMAKFQDPLHKLARRKMGLLRAKMQSLDVVHDALLKALKHLETTHKNGIRLTFNSEKEFLSWLYKIVDNKIRDSVRHYKTHKAGLSKEKFIDQTEGYLGMARQVAHQGNPADGWEHKILVDSLLKELTDDEKYILFQKHVYDTKFTDIAKGINKSPDACRKKYERIIQKLRKIVQGE